MVFLRTFKMEQIYTTAEKGGVFDNGNATVETVSGTLSSDASLNHLLLTVQKESYTGSPPGTPFGPGDKIYILYSISGTTMTAASDRTAYPADLTSSITLTKQ